MTERISRIAQHGGWAASVALLLPLGFSALDSYDKRTELAIADTEVKTCESSASQTEDTIAMLVNSGLCMTAGKLADKLEAARKEKCE